MTKCKYKVQLQFVIKQIRLPFLFIYHINLFVHMATRKRINCCNYSSNKWSNWSIIELFDLSIYSCIYWYNSFFIHLSKKFHPYNENNFFIWQDGVWVLKLLYLAVQKIRKFVKIYSYWILLLVSTQTSRTTFN